MDQNQETERASKTTLAPEVEHWLAERREAGKTIDIGTCDYFWDRVNYFDPYGAGESGELCSLIKLLFVCSPGTPVWICETDLPTTKQEQLRERFEREDRQLKTLFQDALDLAQLVKEQRLFHREARILLAERQKQEITTDRIRGPTAG